MRFRRTRKGIEAKVDRSEADAIARLLDQLIELLGEDEPGDPLEELVGMSSEPVARPTDPALARLFPDAYPDDDEAAGEFRRFTEGELRAGKRAAAGTMRAQLAAAPNGRVVLGPDDAEAWMGALNDLRLTLGTRLGVTEEMDPEDYREDDPRAYLLAVYSWLGYLQESLIQAVTR